MKFAKGKFGIPLIAPYRRVYVSRRLVKVDFYRADVPYNRRAFYATLPKTPGYVQIRSVLR